MKRSEITLFLMSLAETQLKSTGQAMVRFFALPTAYYLPDRVLVFSSEAELARRIEAHGHYLRSVGVERISPRNVTVLDATDKRAYVALDWEYLSVQGDLLRRSQVRYVLNRNDVAGDMRIELVDYSVIAYPQYMERPS